MNWKDVIKAPPFDIQERTNAAMEDNINQLDKQLEQYLDPIIEDYIDNKPFQATFSVPMGLTRHQLLLRLAGSEKGLQTAIARMYNVKSVEFKRGEIPGYTQGKMAYWIEK